MEKLVQLDRKAMVFLNNLGNTSLDPFWILISEKWFWIPLYIIFFYLLYKNLTRKQFLYSLLFVAIGLTISDQLATIFKIGIGRIRPCHDPSLEGYLREIKCGGTYGFYSAHASNSFFLAQYLTILLRKKIKILPILLFVWASILAYSRVYLGQHFPMDILFGALMGFLIGGFMASLYQYVIKKNKGII